ncbi:hypothetical protein [Pseudalkalibacillus sp. NRS-1564]|uniref:hypothetical protein n=1 Tax=Pseudalkalibacillus sp. NRS-1564 TaxID=3233900 RepID=UPI003D2B0A56
MCNSSPSSSFCCPAPCSTPNFFGNNPTLMAIKRCLPIRTICQDEAAPVPVDLLVAPVGTPAPSLASGFLSIINTSSVANDCVMTLIVTDDTGAATEYTIDAQSSLVLELTNVTLIQIQCTSAAPPTPDVFCTATVEMDLQYTAGL